MVIKKNKVAQLFLFYEFTWRFICLIYRLFVSCFASSRVRNIGSFVYLIYLKEMLTQ